jgi:predicted transcriptional regulator
MSTESPTELSVLQEISDKVSQLLTLTRLANSQAIADFKKQIEEDPVFQAILDLADETLSSSELKAKVTEKTKASEPTIKRRIALLMEKGALYAKKKGHEIYYGDTGLYS